MKINKKIIGLVMLLSIMLIQLSVYASTFSINNVVDEATPLTTNEAQLTNKITSINNDEVTLELNLNLNKNKIINSNSEILFLIDNSSSMGAVLEDKVTTRKVKVVNSTSELIKKIHNNNPDVKMAIMSFSEGQQLVQNFTNDENLLLNGCNSLIKSATAGGTNMATALNVAKQKFSANIENKILVLLTDGFPTDGDSNTKAALQDKNVYILSTLVGLDDSSKERITSIFGTNASPVADRFYNIQDKDIETTISKNIYNRILEDFQTSSNNSVNNIIIEDSFPEEITNNFNIIVNGASKGNIYQENNNITWEIGSLESGSNANLVYTLKLKDGFDESIIEKILDVDQKVKLSYSTIERNNQSVGMVDTPQIKIATKEENVSISNKPTTTPKSKKADTTITKTNIPYTGTNTFILIAIILGVISSILLKRKMNSIK